MNQFELKLMEYSEGDFPNKVTFLWSPEEAEKISKEHKDQIHFINEDGAEFLNNFYKSSKIEFNEKCRHPFNEEYYSNISRFEGNWNDEKEVKKWLYNRGIPFSKYVLMTSDRSGKPVLLTWKMVIKYWKGIFWEEDIFLLDTSFKWCFYYYHESEFYFGKDIIFDRKKEDEKAIELNKNIQEWMNKLK